MKNMLWRFTFGQYKGETIKWVLNENPLYVLFLLNKLSWFDKMIKDEFSSQDRNNIYGAIKKASKTKGDKKRFDDLFGLGFSEVENRY